MFPPPHSLNGINAMIAEMTSDPSIVADIPTLIGISDTDRLAAGDIGQQGGGTEKMIGVASSLSWQFQFSRGLPPELLSAVFLEYARDSASNVWDATTVPHWVAVSYVCHYWRNVALHCANLWGSHLFFVSPEWMDELLRRSKNVPLIARVDLRHSGPHMGSVRSLEKALGDMERIQDLRINFPDDMIEIIQPRLNVAAPLLRSLYLSSGINHQENHFVMNKDTLPGAMPDLQKVYLSVFRVDWSSPMFNGLTELTLDYLYNGFVECWSVSRP